MGAGHRAPLPSKKEVPLEKGGDVSGWLLLTDPSTSATCREIIDFVS